MVRTMPGNMFQKSVLTFAVAVAGICCASVTHAQALPLGSASANTPKTEEILDLPDLSGNSPALAVTPSPAGKSGSLIPPILPPAPAPALLPKKRLIKQLPVPVPPVTSGDVSSAPAPPVVAEIPDSSPHPADYDTNISLMFSADDIYKITQMLKLYDSYEKHKQTQNEISALFESSPSPVDETRPLPNLYLGSIVYYSSGIWYVSLNGSIITSASNLPSKEYYVSRISRKEAEIVWKPVSVEQVYGTWDHVIADGKKPLANITVDRTSGTIKLRIRPNQTFVTRDLAIREGLVRSESALGR